MRGQFHRSDAKLNLPVYRDEDVRADLLAIAVARGATLSEVADDLLKKAVAIIEDGK
jgi:hypothetical protein